MSLNSKFLGGEGVTNMSWSPHFKSQITLKEMKHKRRTLYHKQSTNVWHKFNLKIIWGEGREHRA